VPREPGRHPQVVDGRDSPADRLRRHFEQNLHVRHRLERYGAGHAMDLVTATPETIAEAIAAALDEGAQGAEVERDGAARATRLIAGLL
jgi:hypothetical protein